LHVLFREFILQSHVAHCRAAQNVGPLRSPCWFYPLRGKTFMPTPLKIFLESSPWWICCEKCKLAVMKRIFGNNVQGTEIVYILKLQKR